MADLFYKFKPFNEFLVEELCRGDIYYSPPESFNDPMDCSPLIEPDVHGDNLKELYHKIVSYQFGEEAVAQMLHAIDCQIGEYEKPYPYKSLLEDYMYDDVLKSLKNIFCNYGVLSMTKRNNSPLMWSHYADQHRGVCIEYKLVSYVEIKPRRVEYTRPRAISAKDILEWVRFDPEMMIDKIKEIYFFSKAKEWEYEDEWRCLSENSGANPCPFEISSMFFGMRCSSSIVRTVVGILYPNRHDIDFYHMRPVDGGFDLRARVINPEEIMRELPRQSVLLAFPPLPYVLP